MRVTLKWFRTPILQQGSMNLGLSHHSFAGLEHPPWILSLVFLDIVYDSIKAMKHVLQQNWVKMKFYYMKSHISFLYSAHHDDWRSIFDYVHIFLIKGHRRRFRGLCTCLPHSLKQNLFQTVFLGFIHHLPTTKNPFLDFNINIKDCSDLIT